MRSKIMVSSIVGIVTLAAAVSFGSTEDPVGFLRGKWRIGKKSYCPGICAMNRAKAKTFRGRTLEYSSDRMSNGQKTCTSPRYERQELSADEFFREYRCAPSDIGLTGKVVRTISISCPSREAGWPTVGDLALIKDSNMLLTLWDGVFFEVHRE